MGSPAFPLKATDQLKSEPAFVYYCFYLNSLKWTCREYTIYCISLPGGSFKVIIFRWRHGISQSSEEDDEESINYLHMWANWGLSSTRCVCTTIGGGGNSIGMYSHSSHLMVLLSNTTDLSPKLAVVEGTAFGVYQPSRGPPTVYGLHVVRLRSLSYDVIHLINCYYLLLLLLLFLLFLCCEICIIQISHNLIEINC